MVALSVGIPAGTIGVAEYGSDRGWWAFAWRHWTAAWSSILALLLLALLALALAWIRRPGLDRRGVVMCILGGVAVVVAVLDSFHTERVVGCRLVGATLGIVSTLTWLARWVTHHQRTLHKTGVESLRDGLEQLGRVWMGPLYWRVILILKGPNPYSDKPVRHEMTRRHAVGAGVAVVALGWAGFTWTATAAASAFVDKIAPRPAEVEPSPPLNEPAESTPPADVGVPSVPMTIPVPRQVLEVPEGRLRCPYQAGEGPDLPEAVQAVLDKAVDEARQTFHLCPTGLVTWRGTTEVYEQPVFTNDGAGAALVAWFTGEEWVATFVSSDDAAAYRLVDQGLDWTMLGRPLPFIPCDGLSVQPMVGWDRLVVGAGIRVGDDAEGRADRPLYVWGSTMEVLLHRPGGLLRLPVGMPTLDEQGPTQHFQGGGIVRSPHNPAEHLTLDRLEEYCSR